jgi:nitrogen-specific signal transduction histidine kinase
VRKYAEEIRKAGMQATGLVRQLLAVARPKTSEPRLSSLNEIADGMRNLLVRLIGENIELKFNLDPNLGLVKMDPTQSQQILLKSGAERARRHARGRHHHRGDQQLQSAGPCGVPARKQQWGVAALRAVRSVPYRARHGLCHASPPV